MECVGPPLPLLILLLCTPADKYSDFLNVSLLTHENEDFPEIIADCRNFSSEQMNVIIWFSPLKSLVV